MKRTAALSLSVALAFALAACAPSGGLKTGAAAGESFIKLLPKSTMGVVAVDVARAMSTEAAKKALDDPQAKAKYDEFVKMSGIDPMKDISYFGFGLVAPAPGAGAAAEPEAGFIVTMTYDKARLLALMKEKAPELEEEMYNGVAVYSNLDGDEGRQTTQAAFLDASHIVIGSARGVRGIIDVHQKKADSLAKNTEFAAVFKKADKSGLAWGAFAIPQEMLKKSIAASPQIQVLEGVTGLTMSFDYRLAKFTADIRTIGGTKEQNEKLASTLNGFKAMGAMFASQEPVVGEALEAIDIHSGGDYTQILINMPQELLDKLGKMVQAKAGDLIKITKDEPAAEIK
ncbi:MAG: DUF3352 domain-containing protein [Acidobacteria bacterium]|jgi:hypothetical protein|nr:DUF3352 domain-containing protein [Acidobacteriota bacterium]